MLSSLLVAVGMACVGWPARVQTDAGGMVRVRVEAFDVRVSPELIGEPALCVRTLTTLRGDLSRLESVLPVEAFGVLRERVTIWIEHRGAVVPGGMSGRGMVFHPSAVWLRTNGLDPARAGGVEIVRAQDYLEWREHQPMMVLHEMAHAWHHVVVGVDDERIVGAFERAQAGGRYGRVRYVQTGDDERREAYALVSATEYFSELTEAYFGLNDYEPFDRAGLLEFDPVGHGMVESVWGVGAGVP